MLHDILMINNKNWSLTLIKHHECKVLVNIYHDTLQKSIKLLEFGEVANCVRILEAVEEMEIKACLLEVNRTFSNAIRKIIKNEQ